MFLINKYPYRDQFCAVCNRLSSGVWLLFGCHNVVILRQDIYNYITVQIYFIKNAVKCLAVSFSCISLPSKLPTMPLPKQNFSALQSMDMLYRIEVALAGEGNLIVFSLKQAIQQKQPANLIIRTCKDMIQDNYNAMSFILGTSLCDRIKAFDIWAGNTTTTYTPY